MSSLGFVIPATCRTLSGTKKPSGPTNCLAWTRRLAGGCFFWCFWVFCVCCVCCLCNVCVFGLCHEQEAACEKSVAKTSAPSMGQSTLCFLSKLSYPSSFLLFIDHSFTHLSLSFLVLYHPFLSFLIPDHSHYPFPSSPYAFLILFCALSSILILSYLF